MSVNHTLGQEDNREDSKRLGEAEDDPAKVHLVIIAREQQVEASFFGLLLGTIFTEE